MEKTKLIALDTGKTIATIDVVCLMDLKKGLTEKSYHVLVATPTDLDKLRDATCEPIVLENLADAVGDGSLLVGYAAEKADAKWQITGALTDRDSKPLSGVRILAYDKDTAKADDFLGCTFTDDSGYFEIGYDEADFKSKKLIDLEGNPDIYLELSDLESGVEKRTAVRGESDEKEHFDLKISPVSKTRMLQSIAGRYYIEEDLLQKEIDELKALTAQDAQNANGHFLLGLCFIEMVKMDLRKSEWVAGEIRSDDDIFAMLAIECFDKVADLDPDRAEEARHYRSYAQELQDLAL